jgi:lipoate-protein ligase A
VSKSRQYCAFFATLLAVISNVPELVRVTDSMNDPLTFLVAPPLTISGNIALDRLLMQAVGEGTMPEHLRLYVYTDEAVVLGLSQTAGTYVNISACREDGCAVLKRFSGGGTVYIGTGCIVYSVILKTGGRVNAFNVREAYRYVFAPIIDQFSQQGIPVSFFPPCDLAVHSRKIAGNAQAQKHGATLVHGSFLVDADKERIKRYLKHPAAEPDYRSGRSHDSFLTNLSEYGCQETDIANLLQSAWTDSDTICEVPEELIEKAVIEENQLIVDG